MRLSWMASPAMSALSVRTSPLIGAATVPTSWAMSTSREGRRAIERTSSALRAVPLSTPPLNSSTLVARAASLSALAASAASPRTMASAVGPTSKGLSDSAPAWSAARSESEFLTTRKRASTSRRRSRRSAAWATVSPR